ncbi:MAG: hypothetical protein GYB55_10265 [Cytophagales bacterium]|nr:hypothetical protein [Cytophagales bacterium]|tara:strand:- start:42716 stop:42988 length:273 start_codon:yes stop_codon:yes gene_type:complete
MKPTEKTALIFKALDELAIIEHLPNVKEKLMSFEVVKDILSPCNDVNGPALIHINTALRLINNPIGQTYYLNELSGFVSYQLGKALDYLL